MSSHREINRILRNIFGDVKSSSNSQFQVNCPKCQENDGLNHGDEKYNLEINIKKQKFRCWKCDDPKFYGNLSRLIKTFGTEDDYLIYKDYAAIYSDPLEDQHKEEKPVFLPKEFILFKDMVDILPSHMEAYNYMVDDRKIPFDLLIKFKVGFCTDGFFSERIIIPSYNSNGLLNYFVGRTYKNIKPKYRNPDVAKESIIFNESNINWDSTVYLVEGGFELLSLPINTIPLLGKDLPNKLIQILKIKKPNIILIFDPDAFNNMIDAFEILYHIYHDEYYKVRLIELKMGNNDLDEIRKKYGIDKIKSIIMSTSRQTTIDDYFKKRKNNLSNFFRRIDESTKRGRGADKLYTL